MALTLLQQSSLCPLPLAAQPLHWGHAQALSLYPLPHAVVLADTSPQATFRHHGCTVLNPVRRARLRAACMRARGGVCVLHGWRCHV